MPERNESVVSGKSAMRVNNKRRLKDPVSEDVVQGLVSRCFGRRFLRRILADMQRTPQECLQSATASDLVIIRKLTKCRQKAHAVHPSCRRQRSKE